MGLLTPADLTQSRRAPKARPTDELRRKLRTSGVDLSRGTGSVTTSTSRSPTLEVSSSPYSLTRKRLPAGSVLIRLGASHTVNALRRRVPNAKPFSDVIDELILEEFAKLPPELRDSDAGSSLLGIDRLAKLRNRLENPKLRKLLLLAYKRSVKAGKDPRFVWSRLVLTAVVARSLAKPESAKERLKKSLPMLSAVGSYNGGRISDDHLVVYANAAYGVA